MTDLCGNLRITCVFLRSHRNKSRQKGFSLRHRTYGTHIWHLFPSATMPKLFPRIARRLELGKGCAWVPLVLWNRKEEKKHIMNVNAQKHKAAQWQLPRTAWHSWQFERSAHNAFQSSRTKDKRQSYADVKELNCQSSSQTVVYSCKKEKRRKKRVSWVSRRPCTWPL